MIVLAARCRLLIVYESYHIQNCTRVCLKTGGISADTFIISKESPLDRPLDFETGFSRW